MELLSGLNTEQLEAVTFEKGPLLIVAGAGTGKTTVVTKRIAHLILEKEVSPDHILALTFTEKAAGEMEERVDMLLPYGYVDLWISTFHSFCERVLREHAIDIGVSSDFTLLDQTRQWLLMRNHLEDMELDYYRPLGNPNKFIHSLLSHFSRCKDEEIYPEEYLKYADELMMDADKVTSSKDAEDMEGRRVMEVANAYHHYQRLLLENNALDFGDLINYTLKLFKERPQILEKYREQFKYILVDEFQDTNWAQFSLIKLLAAPKNNLTVVADDDQSIYRFRGASMSNILEFKKEYPSSKEIFLVENYRSVQNILDKSYEFISLNNPNRLEYQLNTQNKDSKISKKLNSNLKDLGVIEHIHEVTLEDEINAVCEKIVDLYKREPETQWQDFAILVRANHQADAFMEKLALLGAPYTFLASRGLYSKKVILDLMAYLNLITNFYDNTSCYRVLSMDLWALTHEDLMEILYYSRKKGCSYYKALQNSQLLSISEASKSKLEVLKTYLEKHAALSKTGRTIEVAYSFLIDLGYLKFLESQGERIYYENISYLNQFFKFIEAFERDNQDKGVKKFLDFMELITEAGDEGSLSNEYELDPDTIKLMTVHASKGLEFKYVFIVNMVDQRFPTNRRAETIKIPEELIKETLPDEGDFHLQEERRLFYVAMTRAKHGLFLSSASNYGGVRKKKISRFLVECGFKEPETLPKQQDLESALKAKMLESPVESTDTIRVEELIPNRFSFTQLKVFDTCPWQYRYAHLLKIPILGRPSFSFGQTMHSTMQEFFKRVMEQSTSSQQSLFDLGGEAGGKVPTLEELLEIYESSWLTDWYLTESQQKEYKEKGRKILREFYKKHEGNFPVPLGLERGFTLKIADYTLGGKIDRIDPLPDGTCEIIDYKTGRVPKDETKIDRWNKNQLLIYQMAASEVFRYKVGKVTFYYLEENKAISFLGSDKDLIKLKEDVLEKIQEIRKSEFHPKPGPYSCKYCDFKDICEFRSL